MSNPLELYDENNVLIASSYSDTLLVYPVLRCMNNKSYVIKKTNKCGTNFGIYNFTMQVTPTIAYDLWAKDAPEDDGNIPTTDLFIWNSSDIWVRKIADNMPEHEEVRHNPNQNHTIYVKIRNRGTQTSIPQKLHLYWTYGRIA